jgi:hypothetical protein
MTKIPRYGFNVTWLNLEYMVAAYIHIQENK